MIFPKHLQAKMIPHRHKLIILLSSVFLLSAIFACSPKENILLRRTQFIMGTLVEITVRASDQEKAQLAISLAFDEMVRLEKLMSTHLPDSEISRINATAGKMTSLAVSPDVLKVIRRGIRWGNKSDGALDISIGPVSNLWRFNNDSPLPAVQELSRAVGLVNYQNIDVSESNVRLKLPGMSLNLGAIAKGYAVDKAMTVLQNNGIQHGLINAGGDLKVMGQRKDGQPWNIGLQHPRQPEKLIASFSLSDRAVATSGDYQKYFMKENKRYHHILDPAIGIPARGVISTTIVATTVMDADALATAVFVMGPEKGMKLVDSLNRVEAMMVTESGASLFSKNFKSQPGFVFQGFKDDPTH